MRLPNQGSHLKGGKLASPVSYCFSTPARYFSAASSSCWISCNQSKAH